MKILFGMFMLIVFILFGAVFVSAELELQVDASSAMNRCSARIIEISGGTPPYIWQINGTGFRLDTITESKYKIIANNSACGSAKITVTDSENITNTVTIRNEGSWGNYYCRKRVNYCVGGQCGSSLQEFIIGDHKFTYNCCSNSCGENCPDVQTLDECSDGATHTFLESEKMISIMVAYKWECDGTATGETCEPGYDNVDLRHEAGGENPCPVGVSQEVCDAFKNISIEDALENADKNLIEENGKSCLFRKYL